MRTTATLLAAAAVLLVACSSDERTGSATVATTTPASPVTTAAPEATAAPDTAVPETTASAEAAMDVSVMGLWSGPEFDSFETIMSTWEADTGGTVDWTGARDLTAELREQIDAGTPPDIAILPNVGLMHELAADGRWWNS